MGPKNIVILTGAGISAESGIKTFRDNDGLWENHRLEEVATPEAFQRNPEQVQRFYNERRRLLLTGDVTPNPAHYALAELEQAWPEDRVLLVTQNIDNLHEKAGSHNMVHMHGELLKGRCQQTDALIDLDHDLSPVLPCPACQNPGCLRPHVVWFGEMPLSMERILAALSQCDLFISIGTSGNVYPAAGFVEQANQAGAQTVELNLEPSQRLTAFAEHRHGPASQLVPAYVKELLAAR